jgi:hypothetical protein
MDEMTRSKLEMGRRALEFCRAHPDTDAAYLALVARLERLMSRAAGTAGEDRRRLRLTAGSSAF